MKPIRDLAPKPSDALGALVRGMRKFQHGSPTFEIDMSAFGRFYGKGAHLPARTCGCAANVTLQILTGRRFTPTALGLRGAQYPINTVFLFEQIAPVFDMTAADVRAFCLMIERFRLGRPDDIERFYGVTLPKWAIRKLRRLRILAENRKSWPIRLRRLDEITKQLKQEGL